MSCFEPRNVWYKEISSISYKQLIKKFKRFKVLYIKNHLCIYKMNNLLLWKESINDFFSLSCQMSHVFNRIQRLTNANSNTLCINSSFDVLFNILKGDIWLQFVKLSVLIYILQERFYTYYYTCMINSCLSIFFYFKNIF